MDCRVIQMEQDPRKAHFEYFHAMANPYVGLTVNVDVTTLLDLVKETHSSFFLTFLYAASRAANSVPELRPWLQPTGHLDAPPQGKVFFVISKWEAYGERQPTTPELAAAMPEEALIYEDDAHKIYGFESDEAMRAACGFGPFGA